MPQIRWKPTELRMVLHNSNVDHVNERKSPVLSTAQPTQQPPDNLTRSLPVTCSAGPTGETRRSWPRRGFHRDPTCGAASWQASEFRGQRIEANRRVDTSRKTAFPLPRFRRDKAFTASVSSALRNVPLCLRPSRRFAPWDMKRSSGWTVSAASTDGGSTVRCSSVSE